MPGHEVGALDRGASRRRRSREEPRQEYLDQPVAPAHAAILDLQRAAGNRAVARAVHGGPAAPVQRWAWVSAAQVMASDPALDPRMKAMTTDAVVRDYGSMTEFKEHAAGSTDYLGNLPASSGSPGTWVRFGPSGTNLLGEDHTKVTMEHVAAAVGTKSFIYEPFATDDLSALPSMKAAYETENAARFAKFGVAAEPDKRQFGGESLFPKIAFAFTLLGPYLDGSQPLAELKTGGYVGQPLQRYLKIAWGYAADVGRQKVAKAKLSAEDSALADVHAATTAALDGFITALPVDGFLGDTLDTKDGRTKLAALASLCKAVVVSMTARMTSDAGLSTAERTELGKMPRGTNDERRAAFAKWRNLHFSRTTRAAVARGVRYAGMGQNHLAYLEAEGLPSKSRGYEMADKDLGDFEVLTGNLKKTAKTP